MNKAFVREPENDEDDPELAQTELAPPPGHKNYITPGGFAKLKQELEHLIKHERPRVVEIVSWAASNGDRSENGDYIYGKRRLREIDRRIRFLGKRIDIAEVVDPLRQTNCSQVFFGARVTVSDGNGEESVYTIVGIDEADATSGKISWISPLARALIKSREGDTIRFKSPSGFREMDVIEVVYQTIL